MTIAVHYPESLVGRRLCEFFAHRYCFILATINAPSDKPHWQTITSYPLEHRNLWNRFNDPKTLVGLSFERTTRYLMADIDVGSTYHPHHDEKAYAKLLGLFEDVGLPASVVVCSSASEGLHVYFPLPDAYPTYEVAALGKMLAVRNGFRVKQGSLEFFPNTKTYNPAKPTAYKAHRLPLQQGSCLLDKDFLPYSRDIAVWLDQMEAGAAAQDKELFEGALRLNREARVNGRGIRYGGGSLAAERWRVDLEEQIAAGWTDYHQTNDLLRIVATYGRVFAGLSTPHLAEYVQERAVMLPGYADYCRHQHHIEGRSRDWARCVEKFYYPYGTNPTRTGSFAEMAAEGKGGRENEINQTRQAAAIERIEQAVAHLRQFVSELPTKVGELKNLIIRTCQSLFGVRVSDQTLQKHKRLWHPHTTSILPPASPPEEPPTSCHTPDVVVQESEPAQKEPESLYDKESEILSHTPLAMKVLDWQQTEQHLLYRGQLRTGLVEIANEKRPQLRSIEPAEIVVITNAHHTSFFYPDREERLLVYVKPVVGVSDWQCYGVAVRAIDLHPIDKDDLSSSSDDKPQPSDKNGLSLADDG